MFLNICIGIFVSTDNDIFDLDTFGELLESNGDDLKIIVSSIGLRAKLRKKFMCLTGVCLSASVI